MESYGGSVSSSKIAKVELVDENSEADFDEKIKIPKLGERLTEELVIALVGPVGSGCTTGRELLGNILEEEYVYEVHYYHLSEYISDGSNLVEEEAKSDLTGVERIDYLQTVGDKLRKACGNEYLAAKAVEVIAEQRDIDGFGKTTDGQSVPKKLRRVHIIDSLKHPEEIKLLRATYGEIFWLIGVFAPLAVREERLEYQEHLDGQAISAIMQRDYTENDEHGQNVRDVFYQADFFLRNDQDNNSRLKASLERFVEILFGSPVHTPTLDESSMYAAYAEAAKSACLSRQVGAAIVSSEGELIGLGRNDVPVFGGGLYEEDHGDCDHRCHSWKDRHCHNDAKKEELYQQIHQRLQKAGLLTEGVSEDQVSKEIQATDVKMLIEYSRSVHAEMDAITSVARSHKDGILGGILFSTTFPCHSCARHIVASGIMKVFFIEPYPKSLAIELHSDAVSEREADKGKKVLFLQYTGIAPKNILKLFKTGIDRKEKGGKLRTFNKKIASPIVAVSLDDYATHEKWVIEELVENEEQASGDRQAVIPGIGRTE